MAGLRIFKGMRWQGDAHHRVIDVKVTHDGYLPFETRIGIDRSIEKPVLMKAWLDPAE